MAVLSRTRHGSIEFIEGDRVTEVGETGTQYRCRVTINSPKVWRQLLRGSTGLAHAYSEGYWDCDEMLMLTQIAGFNVDRFDRLKSRFAFLIRPAQRLTRMRPDNKRSRAREQIAAHYDLGNDMFEMFLDSSMNYSSAVYQESGQTLEEAQINKMNRICDRLELGPDDHLLEIGTGWGALARHAALRHGCRVTTTTISDRQFAFATRRVREAGLEDRVTVLHDHYRDLRGTYDALVSVEMIEAVDWREHEDFFAACGRLVRPGGRAALQAITIPDHRFDLAKNRQDFIKRVIFPGGCLPSIGAIREATARTSGWELTDAHDLGRDYAETLRRWRATLRARAHELPAHGLGPHFARTFDFYFAYCEAGFDDGLVGDVQLTFTAPGAQSGGAGAGSGIVSGSGVRAGAASRTAAPSTSAAPTSWTPLSTSSNAR